ncbi:hypothetical protein LJC48_02930 [Desulfovibrio sp. OttesenSCG-928-C06]|nr:hypothetical protein [Desulfovibrio sp. OttesenSCG-928-C06]
MTEGMPRNELVRRAFEWVVAERSFNPAKALRVLLDEAGMRFNLTPMDDMALARLLDNELPGAECGANAPGTSGGAGSAD